MKISCISFTKNGSLINKKLGEWFDIQGISCDCQAFPKYAKDACIKPLEGTFKEWCKEKFNASDVLIFIGATGIAVRGISTYVKDKKTDPAVLVIDEQGNFVISLLSGHIGGANEMAEKIALYLNAVPVVTTGTDVNHTLAIDVFASKNSLHIESMELAKKVAASFIDKKKIGFKSELKVDGTLPDVFLSKTDKGEMAVYITIHDKEFCKKKLDLDNILRLIPVNVHLGIGCRRDTPYEAIEEKVMEVIKANHIDFSSVAGVASIDLKKDEKGLNEFCKRHKLPFTVYSADELNKVKGDFTPSAFVSKITGVENVCERSSVLDALSNRIYAKDNNIYGDADVIVRKTAGNGVTVALAIEDWSVRFE